MTGVQTCALPISVDNVTNERYEYIRGEQDKARAQGAATNILPNVGGPALPPLAPSAAPAPSPAR